MQLHVSVFIRNFFQVVFLKLKLVLFLTNLEIKPQHLQYKTITRSDGCNSQLLHFRHPHLRTHRGQGRFWRFSHSPGSYREGIIQSNYEGALDFSPDCDPAEFLILLQVNRTGTSSKIFGLNAPFFH